MHSRFHPLLGVCALYKLINNLTGMLKKVVLCPKISYYLITPKRGWNGRAEASSAPRDIQP